MEVMLGGNFNEEYVSGIKDEIRQMSEAYRDLFARCSVYLENLSSSSIEKKFSGWYWNCRQSGWAH